MSLILKTGGPGQRTAATATNRQLCGGGEGAGHRRWRLKWRRNGAQGKPGYAGAGAEAVEEANRGRGIGTGSRGCRQVLPRQIDVIKCSVQS
jgi:hypothetical protein